MDRIYLETEILKAFGHPTFLFPQDVITVVSIAKAKSIEIDFLKRFIAKVFYKC